MLIYLIRHAQENIFNADSDGGITPLGRQQSYAAAHYLEKRNIAVLLSSDLPRAKETAEVLGKVLGLKAKKFRQLREIQTPKDAWSEYVRNHHPDFAFHPGGGESLNELLKRVKRAWGQIQRSAQEGNTAVVCHSIFIKALLYDLGFKDHLVRNDAIANTGITILEVQDGRAELKRFNYYSHLKWLRAKEIWWKIKSFGRSIPPNKGS